MVSNPNYLVVTTNDATELNYAALIGRAFGVTISDCTNNASVTINQIASVENTLTTRPNIAGVVAFCEIFGTTSTQVTNCTNNGTITYQDNVCDGTHARGTIGGIVGLSTATNVGPKFANFVNNGEIVVKANITVSNIFIGGVVGVAYGPEGTIDDSTNNGAITIHGGYNVSEPYIGGIASFLEGVTCKNVVNNGAITLGSESATVNSIKTIYIGGLFGKSTDKTTDARIENAVNDAPITVYGNSTACTALRVAGITSWSQGVCPNIKNTEKGDITIKGTYIFTSNTENGYAIAGLIGYKTSNDGSKCENRGDILLDATITSTAAKWIFIGGLAGRSHQWMRGTNYGNITILGDTSGITTSGARLYVGGSTGYSAYSIVEATNYGDILFQGNQLYPMVGGIIGWLESNNSYSLYNYGNVSTIGDFSNAYLGGIAGYAGNSALKLSDSANEGNILFQGSSAYNVYLGGIVAGCGTVTLENAVNGALDPKTGKPSDTLGKITFAGTMTAERLDANAGTLYIGSMTAAKSNANRTNCINYGDILIDGAGDKDQRNIYNCFVGGMTYNAAASAWTNCHNHGDITITEKTNITNSTRIGGLAANVDTSSEFDLTLDGCSNTGNIVHKGRTATSGAGILRLGGCFATMDGKAKLTILNGFTNSGDVIFEGSQENTNTNETELAGFIPYTKNDTYAITIDGNLVNTGNIICRGNLEKNGGWVMVGGLFAYYQKTVDFVHTNGAFICTGDVELSGNYKARNNQPYVGGFIAYSGSKGAANVHAYCNVTAIGVNDAGIISGKVRSNTVKYTNSTVGGSLSTAMIEIPDPEADAADPDKTIIVADKQVLTADNYFNYIYGTAISATDAESDNCVFAATAPTIPTTPAE